ncbi:cytochrome c family protein [Peteryoungia desertarenae]|uniref:Cytochrome c family protein n=1 Tax=Peteryoungia desertarenae TaxID=1813451 RepID=A0ABX6QS92_9HYPH|nr:cytochrome c family protein [Peteryoungia desertarenae]QLF71057.1 cytochrome c family protein [Peteryoungia desertarenae]
MTKIAVLLSLAAAPALAEGDAKAGAQVFKACQACHSIADAKNRVGPSLMGVIGRPVASVADYKYSPAMIAFGEGKVWDEGLMAEYLPQPRVLVKGTKMAYAGLKDDKKIADLIAFLKDPAVAGQ